MKVDLLIIGAGPAGMAAAQAAAPSGARIAVIDDNPAPGGQIWRDGPQAHLPEKARTLRQSRFMLEGLVVDAGRMRRNLDLTGGLIVAEAVMMALAQHVGRGTAHDMVYGACRAALDKGTTLLAELERLPEVTRHLDAKRLAELTDPVNYLGSASAMIDRVLGM